MQHYERSAEQKWKQFVYSVRNSFFKCHGVNGCANRTFVSCSQ